MKFKVVENWEKTSLKGNNFKYTLPLIEHSTMIPLYIGLAGTNKIFSNRDGRYAKSGVVIYDSYNYIIKDIMFTMLYIDKLDYYKEMQKEAIQNGYQTIDIKHTDTEKIRYKLKDISMNYPEQVYLKNVLPVMIGDMLEEQLEVEELLKINNLILV